MDPRFISYEYLIIINADTTPVRVGQSGVADLIELSWAVVANGGESSSNIAIDGLLDKQQVWILPEKGQVDLTDQPELERGVRASEAFKIFEEYVRKNLSGRGKTYCLTTDRMWDFHALRGLYGLHSITSRPTHWNRVFNLRVEFTRKYGSMAKPENSTDMMELLRISSVPIFSALDECMAQAAIVSRMIRDGYTFLNPELLGEKSRVPPTIWEVSTVTLRLSGLSWDVKPFDIINFFTGINIAPENIIICLTKIGMPSGQALVQFSSISDADTGFSRNGGRIGHQTIHLRYASRSDFDKTLLRQRSIKRQLYDEADRAGSLVADDNSSELKSKTLQVHRTEQRSSIDVVSPPTTIANSNGGLNTAVNLPSSLSQAIASARWSGAINTSYFPDSDVYIASLSAQHPIPAPSPSPNLLIQQASALPLPSQSNTIGVATNGAPTSTISRSNAGLSSSPNAMMVDQPAAIPSGSAGSKLPSHPKTNKAALLEMCSKYPEGTVVSLRGLPYTVTEAQVLDFFTSFEAIPSSLVLTASEDGRPSGDGFIAFSTAGHARRAVDTQSGKYIGARYVDLAVVN